jgi:hypothetical protein
MKIGILTFHIARNYGAVLQCYCLTETLKRLQHEVKVIDYRPVYLVKAHSLFRKQWLKHPLSLLRFFILFPSALLRRRKFDHFLASLPLQSLAFKSPDNDFDAFVFGSDQIWNKLICNGFDPVYFAGEAAFEGKLKIAYAASSGHVQLTDREQETFLRYMQRFDALGVRETSLQDFLRRHGIPATLTVDPVVLAGRPVLDAIADKAPARRGRYVLCYEVSPTRKVRSFARRIARELGCDVLPVARGEYASGRKCVSPEVFIALFRDAAFVVSSSFHGMALSLMFGKSFYNISVNDQQDERVRSFLSVVGLEGRLIRQESQIRLQEAIDYDCVWKQIEGLRASSLDFLKEALRSKRVSNPIT